MTYRDREGNRRGERESGKVGELEERKAGGREKTTETRGSRDGTRGDNSRGPRY